jgi:hypothetical protein
MKCLPIKTKHRIAASNRRDDSPQQFHKADAIALVMKNCLVVVRRENAQK